MTPSTAGPGRSGSLPGNGALGPQRCAAGRFAGGAACQLDALGEDGFRGMPQPAAGHALDRAQVLGENRPHPGMDHQEVQPGRGRVFGRPANGELGGPGPAVTDRHGAALLPCGCRHYSSRLVGRTPSPGTYVQPQ